MAKKKKNDKHLYNLDIYLAKVIAKDHPNSFCTKFDEFEKPEDFKKAADRYDEKVDEGLRLFAEYFQSLWI